MGAFSLSASSSFLGGNPDFAAFFRPVVVPFFEAVFFFAGFGVVSSDSAEVEFAFAFGVASSSGVLCFLALDFGLGDFLGVGDELFAVFALCFEDFGLAVGLGDSPACASCPMLREPSALCFSSSLT